MQSRFVGWSRRYSVALCIKPTLACASVSIKRRKLKNSAPTVLEAVAKLAVLLRQTHNSSDAVVSFWGVSEAGEHFVCIKCKLMQLYKYIEGFTIALRLCRSCGCATRMYVHCRPTNSKIGFYLLRITYEKKMKASCGRCSICFLRLASFLCLKFR